jgi:hypothetical protein
MKITSIIADHRPRSALCSAAFPVLNNVDERRRVIQTADNIRDIRVSKPVKKVSKIEKKSLPGVGLFR